MADLWQMNRKSSSGNAQDDRDGVHNDEMVETLDKISKLKAADMPELSADWWFYANVIAGKVAGLMPGNVLVVSERSKFSVNSLQVVKEAAAYQPQPQGSSSDSRKHEVPF
jgi:hypothetical protein